MTPQLMKELVKKIIIRPDGSIHIEWNFYDEIGKVIPYCTPPVYGYEF